LSSESGHDKWGHSIRCIGSVAYWATWGAGFASVNVMNPGNMNTNEILTNSSFKAQFPDAEGTNVYDVVYNSQKNVLCIANGWSGVLLVRPNASSQVIDYIDPQYFQNRCIESAGDYIYTGNISGGMSGDLKGLIVFKIKK